MSGFVVGFLIAGLLGPPLLALLSATERLLGVACAFALAQLGLVLATRQRFAAQLALTDVADAVPITPMRTLMSRPLVKLLLAYQVLSMLGTQLVDFLVFDRAAARYATSNELARFTSVFTNRHEHC